MSNIPATVPEITTVYDPLLPPRHAAAGEDRTSRTLYMFLGLFAGRRGASLIVRENVAQQLEDWREDWGYSLPVVVLDTIWNLAFVVVSLVLMIWTAREEQNVPLRVWICGYSLQCLVHVMLVWREYIRRNRRFTIAQSLGSSGSSFQDDRDGTSTIEISTLYRPSRKWENLNTMISYVWFVIGFCTIVPANDFLLHVAPHLFWLAVTFLVVDGFFTAIYILTSCFLLVSVVFCFPCVIGFLYYIRCKVTSASEAADISILPKYRFVVSEDEEEADGRVCRMVPMGRNVPQFSVERVILPDDADCCICLCSYENGSQLHLLPCSHHYHSTCIQKWLKVKATCPLCKYIILRNEPV